MKKFLKRLLLGLPAAILVGLFILPASAAPISVDRQVGASTDDVVRRLTSSYWSDTPDICVAGAHTVNYIQYGSGMRFTDIVVPQGAVITEAYLTLKCETSRDTSTVNTRISGEDVDDAPTFADYAAAFDTRWANRTTARVDWDDIEAWTVGEDYNSSDIKAVIQEITDREGWVSGNDIVIFWEDFDDRSTHESYCFREASSYDDAAAKAPKIHIEYTLGEPPTVTTQVATNIEVTTATGNGTITDIGAGNADKRGFVWDGNSFGDPGDTEPGMTDYGASVTENGDFGVGAFTGSLTGCNPGSTTYVRAWAHNSEGYSYGEEVSFLTKPAAPTNVDATDGAHTNKVVVTWTKSTGATDYHVWRGAVDLGATGDVATFDDVGADTPTITPGVASASNGTSPIHVTLMLVGASANNGTSHTYKVVASNATGDSEDSATDTGYRGVGALTYQWQRSAADSDAAYGILAGAITDPYNDDTAPEDYSGRWYYCEVSADGAITQDSTHDRGYRGSGGSGANRWIPIPFPFLPLIKRRRKNVA